MTKLSIIILTYNSSSYVKSCLKSLYYFHKRELQEKEYEIIILDNASKDNTCEEISNLKSQISNLKLIRSEKNLGFAKGINEASKIAKGEYLLFMNADTQLLDQGLEKMIEFAQKNEKAGIVGGKMVTPSGKEEMSAGKFYNLINIFLLSLGLENIFNNRFSPHKITRVDFVSGGFMLIKNDIFKSLKGFDEKYFMYIEDMDLCFQVGKKNLKTFFFPYATIEHYGQGSSSRSYAIDNIYKGIFYFFKKNKNSLQYCIVYFLLKLKAISAIIIGQLIRDSYLVNTYKKALSS